MQNEIYRYGPGRTGVACPGPEGEGMMEKGLFPVALAVLAGGVASGEDVFLSSPPYNITVTLEYTDPPEIYGSQGYIESYRSVSVFSNVVFGRSISPQYDAMFVAGSSPAGAGGSLPSMQKSGAGVIEYFTLQPAWESDDEAIDAVVTHGPEPFTPTLTLLTTEMAVDLMPVPDDEMAVLPIDPTVWILFSEGFSITDPELVWEYPEFAENSIGGSTVMFSIPLRDLGEGVEFIIDLPYQGDTATGTWTITLEAE